MLNEVFLELASSLNNYNIPYIIIGGQAALLYMEPRFTYDIDITIDIDVNEYNKLIQICNERNWRILVESPISFIYDTMVLPILIESENIRVDIIFSNTDFEKEAIHNPNKIEVNGVDINFCSLDYLIIFKIFSGRQKDLDDVFQILKSNSKIDEKLIEKHLEQLGNLIDKDLNLQFNKLRTK